MADQSTDTPKVQTGEPMSFAVVTCRSVNKELLPEAGMAQRQLHHSSPPQQVGQLTELGTWIANMPLNRLKSVLSKCLS